MAKRRHFFIAAAATAAANVVTAANAASASGCTSPVAFTIAPQRTNIRQVSPNLSRLNTHKCRTSRIIVSGVGVTNDGSVGSTGILTRDDAKAKGPMHLDMAMDQHALLRTPSIRNVGRIMRSSEFATSNIGSISGQYGGFGIASGSDPHYNPGFCGASSDRESLSSLHVSKSSENALGFRVEDFEYFGDPELTNDLTKSMDEIDVDELDFRVEDFESSSISDTIVENVGSIEGEKNLRVKKLDTSKASMTKQRVAASLLRNDRMANEGQKDNAPEWFPWLPAESQIMALKVVELRAACRERGLVTTGKKADLQRRLFVWATVEDRKRVQDRLAGLKDLIEKSKSRVTEISIEEIETSSNSVKLAPYDVDELTNKRKKFTKEQEKRSRKYKRGILGLVDQSFFNTTASSMNDNAASVNDEVDDSPVDESNLPSFTDGQYIFSKSFNAPPSRFSNREVREMYIESKRADQAGERDKAKSILFQLREATPNDMRVVRRLARMEQQDGNEASARRILQQALRLEPNNAHLLQGLGQLERQAGHDSLAIKYFREAVKKCPDFPNPYHALGTMEHTHGNIKVALNVIKDGLKKCPQNHRLHHALGDIYLDAKMLDLAEDAYLGGLDCGPQWSRPFFYTSLSFVSYEKGNVGDCRTLLRQSQDINEGMHAQGVIALAQLEESEGNIREARRVYRDAIINYERKRRERSPFQPKSLGKKSKLFESNFLVDGEENKYSKNYAGDKWVNVFRSWGRMEEIHGSLETASLVYSQAAKLFPGNASLLIKWAKLQAEHGNNDKARILFRAACERAGKRNAEPYRLYAEFEMNRRNFEEAQSILFRGAQAVTESSDIGVDGKIGLACLFHTWGVCEYHLGNPERAEVLFDDALRVTGSGEADSSTRSLILYSMAKLEYSRHEYLLAQHCIGLCLKENLLPGGNSLIWKLWSEVAFQMENQDLWHRCREQALLRWKEEQGGAASDLSRLLGKRENGSSPRLPERTGSAMKEMFRNTPWHSLVCPPVLTMDKSFYNGARLWDL